MDIFDKYASRFNIDLSNANTRKEKIETIINEKKYVFDLLFDYLTNEEKHNYLQYANLNNKESFLISLPSKERISILKDNSLTFSDTTYQYIGLKLTSETEITEYLDLFKDRLGDYFISTIIEKIPNIQFKIEVTNKYIKDEYIKTLVIKSLPDNYKNTFINQIKSITNKVEIILSFNNKDYIKNYAVLKEYSSYRSKLVSATEDEDFIISMFKKIDSLKFRLNLITLITDNNLKEKLYNLIENESIRKFLLSNTNKNEFKDKLKESDLLATKVDKDITIGVELECCNKSIDLYRGLHTIFNDYDIKSDISVKSGFEITSPILHYNVKDLSTLKSVCSLLKENNFYTDNSCGGHIHIGASYFTNEQDYLTLLYLYANTEDILYYICDKEGTIKRPSCKRYAKKIKENIIKSIEGNLFDINNMSITEKLKEISLEREIGLNFKNLGSIFKNTIEFRMPNGEIDFNELLLNIKLFTRLIEVSHELSINPNDKLLSLSKETDETKKLDILLNILFDSDEEKILYKNRYIKNKLLDLKQQKQQLLNNGQSNEITNRLIRKVR